MTSSSIIRGSNGNRLSSRWPALLARALVKMLGGGNKRKNPSSVSAGLTDYRGTSLIGNTHTHRVTIGP